MQEKANLVMTPQERALARLHSAFEGTPHYLCDKVLGILKKEISLGNFDPMIQNPSRVAFFNGLKKKIGGIPPEAIALTLPSGVKVMVYRFDYAKELQDLLESRFYAAPFNVTTDVYGNPSHGEDYSEITKGEWYRRTAAHCAEVLGEHRSEYALLPLVGYCDTTAKGIVPTLEARLDLGRLAGD